MSGPSGTAACRDCGTPLDRPGDFCLTCRTANADAVVVEVGTDRATVTVLRDGEVLGETAITTVLEPDPERRTTERRNYAGRIGDEIRRKRPEEVYAAGDREVIRELRADLHYPVYRVDAAAPIEAALGRRGEQPLAVDERPAAAKLGGSHTTVIGGRRGRRALETVAGHPHVKKVIPGAIDAGGTGSQRGLRAKATRADGNGNLRVLLRDGSSVQETHVVTTAPNRTLGEQIRTDLAEVLAEEGFA